MPPEEEVTVIDPIRSIEDRLLKIEGRLETLVSGEDLQRELRDLQRWITLALVGVTAVILGAMYFLLVNVR